ncbi:phosphoadenosine phosphosulfate reductase domain-containing protein [Heyndrickxia coagulans]|uniref:phosphoadenosine phosphosulfate reductase domain-containing protein n=1 Tax=Heyndrickxia coagulans TaxID=1398 RepID=UPI0006288991|nr:phosphoadenosine phosphosulfate reductase family protein [Heyndrickxia coagulans]
MDLNMFFEIGELNARLNSYKKKKEKSINLSAEQLLKAEKPYLALSGGKDSVAMAYLVDEAAKRVNKDFRMWIHISSASFPGTLETAQKVAKQINRPLDVYDGGDAFKFLSNKQKAIFGKNGVYFDSVRSYAKDKDLVFTGVRAFESKRRSRAVKAKGQVFYSKSMGGITVCQPLAYFRLEDVAAVMAEYNGIMHPIYSKMPINNEKNAMNEEHWIRLGYTIQKDLWNRGTALFIKINYPEIFEKLAEKDPNINNYI